MATDSQTNANRANAQHSTGPKTPEGKQRSSLNATKFGLTGRTVVLPHEDLEVYAAFLQEWTAELQPVGIKETEYVRSIVDCKWRLNRVRSSEDGLYAMDRSRYSDKIDTGQVQTDIVVASALTAEQKAKTLDSISRHEARISREFSKAMQALEEAQAARKAAGQAIREEAIAIFKYHKMLGQSFDPKEFGFELPYLEIERAVRRADLLGQVKIAQASGYNRERFLKAAGAPAA
jgi:hypothetical protein